MPFKLPNDWEPDDWTEFIAPTDWDKVEEIDGQVDWTLLMPYEDDAIPALRMGELVRQPSEKSGIDRSEPLMSSARGTNNWQINLETLWKLAYEHRRYSYAQGFSDTQMDVLRAVEFAGSDRVSIEEIMESNWIEGDPAESTIYKALKELIDKELVERVAQNNYTYDGPNEMK